MPTAVQGYLSKIGIEAELDAMDGAKYAEYQTKGWHSTLIVAPASSWQNFLKSVEQYYMTPNYYVSLKGPDNLKELYDAALATTTVEADKVEAVTRAMYEHTSVVPIMYMGKAHVLPKGLVHDHGYFSQSLYFGWTPEDVWMSKK